MEDGNLLQTWKSFVRGISEEDSSETLEMLQNNVIKDGLRLFPGYNPKREDYSYEKGKIISKATTNAWAAIVVC